MKKAYAIAHMRQANTYWSDQEGWISSLEGANITDDIMDTAGWTPFEGQWTPIQRDRVTDKWFQIDWD
tara:strand:+ start:289 stop:492 length:204 start_codon:yes stop_codon:yes gene_type:complete